MNEQKLGLDRVLPVSARVLPWYCGFLPQSKDMHVKRISSGCECKRLFVHGFALNRQLVHDAPHAGNQRCWGNEMSLKHFLLKWHCLMVLLFMLFCFLFLVFLNLGVSTKVSSKAEMKVGELHSGRAIP